MSARQIGLLGLLVGIWGSVFLLIKYGQEGFSAGFLVFGQLAIAAVVLTAVLARKSKLGSVGKAWEAVRARPAATLFAGGMLGGAFLCVCFGELHVPSGLTAVLAAPTPMVVALIAPFVDSSERVRGVRAVALVAGLAGVALIVSVETVDSIAEVLSALLVLLSAALFAVYALFIKSAFRELRPCETNLICTSAAAVWTLPFALFALPSELPAVRPLFSLFALGVLSGAIAFTLYARLIAEVGAGRSALSSYLVPVVALIYATTLHGEKITVVIVLGLILVVGGVAVASNGGSKQKPSG